MRLQKFTLGLKIARGLSQTPHIFLEPSLKMLLPKKITSQRYRWNKKKKRKKKAWWVIYSEWTDDQYVCFTCFVGSLLKSSSRTSRVNINIFNYSASAIIRGYFNKSFIIFAQIAIASISLWTCTLQSHPFWNYQTAHW